MESNSYSYDSPTHRQMSPQYFQPSKTNIVYSPEKTKKQEQANVTYIQNVRTFINRNRKEIHLNMIKLRESQRSPSKDHIQNSKQSEDLRINNVFLAQLPHTSNLTPYNQNQERKAEKMKKYSKIKFKSFASKPVGDKENENKVLFQKLIYRSTRGDSLSISMDEGHDQSQEIFENQQLRSIDSRGKLMQAMEEQNDGQGRQIKASRFPKSTFYHKHESFFYKREQSSQRNSSLQNYSEIEIKNQGHHSKFKSFSRELSKRKVFKKALMDNQILADQKIKADMSQIKSLGGVKGGQIMKTFNVMDQIRQKYNSVQHSSRIGSTIDHMPRLDQITSLQDYSDNKMHPDIPFSKQLQKIRYRYLFKNTSNSRCFS